MKTDIWDLLTELEKDKLVSEYLIYRFKQVFRDVNNRDMQNIYEEYVMLLEQTSNWLIETMQEAEKELQ